MSTTEHKEGTLTLAYSEETWEYWPSNDIEVSVYIQDGRVYSVDLAERQPHGSFANEELEPEDKRWQDAVEKVWQERRKRGQLQEQLSSDSHLTGLCK